MKKLLLLVLVFAGLALFPLDTFGRRPHGHHRGGDGGKTIGVPLDGGLSVILLSAAGAAFIARRRKKKTL